MKLLVLIGFLCGLWVGRSLAVPATIVIGEIPEADVQLQKAYRLRELFYSVEELYQQDIVPIERLIERRNPKDAKRIAVQVYKTSQRFGLRRDDLLGIMLVENPDFAPRARSFVGATGLMQVMPQHSGKWGCGKDLTRIDVNLCSGAKIYKHYLYESGGNRHTALLRYNGCVNGTNTPNCHQYPTWVEQRTKWVRQQLQ